MPFENVTTRAGITYTGTTFAGAWGDADGDGYPDIWISKHSKATIHLDPDPETLYLNNRDGTFTDVSARAIELIYRDYHGARWADYDNDGDQDMMTSHTNYRGRPITLFQNNGLLPAPEGLLKDVGGAAGLAFKNAHASLGRNSIWLDYDHDGLMDIFDAGDRPAGKPAGYYLDTMVFRQDRPGHFVQTTADVGLSPSTGTPLLADLDGDGWQEVIFSRYGTMAEIFTTHTESGVWENIRSTWMRGKAPPTFDDAVIADFDNDGRPDLYLTRTGVTDEVVLRTPYEIRSYLTDLGPQKFVHFRTSGDPTFTFPTPDGAVDLSVVHVGSSGRLPFTGPKDVDFTLSAANPADQGLAPFDTPGVYVGYDTTGGEWNYVVVPPPSKGYAGWPGRGTVITSTAPISGLRAEGVVLDPPDAPDSLFLNDGTRLVDASVASRIASLTVYGDKCAAGDFDNDGDVDIFVDQATPALNRGNVLLINRGDGTFYRAVAEGAKGTSLGVGGAVAVADYDNDGFLDVLDLAGNTEPPFNALQDGPAQLFHNIPNGNHWLELRLHGNGIDTTTDAIGAKVALLAGGKAQYRENMLGQHIFAQDGPVVHFGLGPNTIITRVDVSWPNGTTTTLHDLAVDQILDVDQPPPTGSGAGQVGMLDPVEPDDDRSDLALLLPMPGGGEPAAAGLPVEFVLQGGATDFGPIEGPAASAAIFDSTGALEVVSGEGDDSGFYADGGSLLLA